MSMGKYMLRRTLTFVPVMFGVLTLTFILSRMMPGNPVYALLPERATQEDIIRITEQLGLDRPILEQYFRYFADLFTGNWGVSISIARNQPVWELVWERFPRTFDIALLSIFIAGFIGLKTGVISATHRNKPRDTVLRGFALVGVAIPVFWMGLILQYFFGFQLDLFPVIGYKSAGIGDPPRVTSFRAIDCLLSFRLDLLGDYLFHLILPVFCLSFITLAGITRQTRSSMLEVLEQDYVRTARAKGCKEKDVINKHARKNALIPTITVIGLQFGYLLGGAILTETTFNLHGIGELLIVSIQNYDYFVLNAVVLISTIMFVIVNLSIDIIYGIVDPRIRY